MQTRRFDGYKTYPSRHPKGTSIKFVARPDYFVGRMEGFCAPSVLYLMSLTTIYRGAPNGENEMTLEQLEAVLQKVYRK